MRTFQILASFFFFFFHLLLVFSTKSNARIDCDQLHDSKIFRIFIMIFVLCTAKSLILILSVSLNLLSSTRKFAYIYFNSLFWLVHHLLMFDFGLFVGTHSHFIFIHVAYLFRHLFAILNTINKIEIENEIFQRTWTWNDKRNEGKKNKRHTQP